MANDDPLVFPNQPGAAHHHTFYGNTSINYASDLNTLSITGNSTCDGGIMNRTAYWAPSLIDTTSGAPKTPQLAIFYYKAGYIVPSNLIVAPPKGLKMIAGNSKAVVPANDGVAQFTCIVPSGTFQGWKTSIPNCNVGETMQVHIDFPQCWDGLNLDSPNHKDHMAYSGNDYPTANKCPASHPIAIPEISVSFNYLITQKGEAANWRLSSDNYAATSPGGYSSHADWVNGWDEAYMKGIVTNCINKKVDCHANLLGDGRTIY
jgi:Domain of unknown function (DUF1996)